MKTNKTPAGLYIHIPFCLTKCPYCGFLSYDDCSAATKQQYVEHLIKEIKIYTGKKIIIDTIFVGGGTPSILTEEQISTIMAAIKVAFIETASAERTIEANPKTLTTEKLKTYQTLGFNRLSIGAQSLNDQVLSALGRVHKRQDILENYRLAREVGFQNINIDLMFGIPEQTRKLWEETLQETITLKPEHISFYSLQLEEKTPFYQEYKDKNLNIASDEIERQMYHMAVEMLKEAGYEHYEISNCALPGYTCRHNLNYWSFGQYCGVGLGAHSFWYDSGRCYNTEVLDKYMKETAQNNLPVDMNQSLNKMAQNKLLVDMNQSLNKTAKTNPHIELKNSEPDILRDFMGEYVFTGLRRRAGIDIEDFRQTFGKDFFEVFKENKAQLQQYIKQGYLIQTGNHLALTEQGIDHSNAIMAEFV